MNQIDNDVKQIHGLVSMGQRLRYQGGYPQQDRMIKDKLWTLQHAIKYSYQGAKIKKYGSEAISSVLINPDKVKQNYDDKIWSAEWDLNLHPGDVFEWLNTGTMWLITLQELTELAYFRSAIRRCNYTINWQDAETGDLCMTHAAIRGPVETKINYIQKGGVSVDTPNHSLEILMPKNKDTVTFFQRYSKFYLQGIEEYDKKTCWRVEGTDTISMPGVLQVIAVEYYSNSQADDLELGIANIKTLEQPVEGIDRFITGPSSIKPKTTVEFTWHGKDMPNWEYDENLPISVKKEGRTIYIRWEKNFSSNFTLKCGEAKKEIKVTSLF